MTDEAEHAALDLIAAYADTWRLLLEYDEDRLKTPARAKPTTGALDLEHAVGAIDAFRQDLAAKGEASPLFGPIEIVGITELSPVWRPLLWYYRELSVAIWIRRGVAAPPPIYRISAAMLSATRAAASCMESRARCAYFAVVSTCAWPSSRPIAGRLSPSASAREAKLWRQS